MRIAIIAHNCRGGGAVWGTASLLRALAKRQDEHQYLVIRPEHAAFDEFRWHDGSEAYVYKGRHGLLARWWFENFVMHRRIADFHPDAIIGMSSSGLRRPMAPQAMYIRQPYLFYSRRHYPHQPLRDRLQVLLHSAMVRRRLKRTKLILCQTPVVRTRFAAKFGYSESQIKVLPMLAPSDNSAPPETGRNPSRSRSTDGEFRVLVLTRYLTHRNPSAIPELCRTHRAFFKERGIRFITTIRPDDHPAAPAYLKAIDHPDCRDFVTNVGALTRPQVWESLRDCDVLWMPTLLETFCLPFVEAMVAGCPILAPDLDFAKYVCGDAAMYYDPWRTDSIAECLIRLADDDQLGKRLKEAGMQAVRNSKRLAGSWDVVADDLLDALNSIR